MYIVKFVPHSRFDFDQMQMDQSKLTPVWKPRYAGVTGTFDVFNYTAEYKMLSKHQELLSDIVERYADNYKTSKQSESQFRSRFWNVVGFLYTTLFKDSGFEHNHIDSRVLKAVNQNYYQIFDILVDEHVLMINNNYLTSSYIRNINYRRSSIASVFGATSAQSFDKLPYSQSYAFTYSFINMEKEAKINREYCWVPMTFTVSTYVYQFITCGRFLLPLSSDKSKAELIISRERCLKDRKFCDEMQDFHVQGDPRNWYDKRIFSLKAFEKRNECSSEEVQLIAEDEHERKLKLIKQMGYDKLEFDEKLFERKWKNIIKSSDNKYSEVDKAKILSELRMIGKSEPELVYNRIYTPFHRIPSIFRECVRFKGQKIVQAYDSKCNVIRMLVKVIEPLVEKYIRFEFFEKTDKKLGSELDRNEFILDRYIMKKHVGELYISKEEFNSFKDFCNMDDPYMLPAISLTCDTPDRIAYANHYPYYDHHTYNVTRNKMKKAFQQFINSKPCAYAFYENYRFNSAIRIVTRFFFHAFPHISLYIQYGSYLGSARKKFLWPHIEANEFKYISSQLHDCIKDYGYDSITVHDAVYMGEDDLRELTSKGVSISDLFEAIINKDPNPKYPSRACARTCEKLFENDYVRQEHDPSCERIMFRDPDDLYEKEREYVFNTKKELKEKHQDWIIDPLWHDNNRNKKRAKAFRKIEQHLNRYLKELIAKDQAVNKYKDLFTNLKECEAPNLSKISKKYSSAEELERDFYNPNGFIATCKKQFGGVTNYVIDDDFTVTFGSMPSEVEEQSVGYNAKDVKERLMSSYRKKFSSLLEKRREELKKQYYSGLKITDYDKWKQTHPEEAAERESAPAELLNEKNLASIYSSMVKRKWDPEKDKDKISIFDQIRSIKNQNKQVSVKETEIDSGTSLFDL